MERLAGKHVLILLQIFLSVYITHTSAISKIDTNSTELKNISSNRTNFSIDRLHRQKLHGCSCGVKHEHVKIVGGVLSKKHSWPWVAAIVYMKDNKGPKLVCGSSVVGHRHLLTAAHCVEYMMEEGIQNFRVILGTNDLNDKDAVIVPVESAISHPKYDEDDPLDYDVGVITIKPIEFSQEISPICITPQNGVPFDDHNAVVAGWGSTYFGGATTTMQMQVMIGIISNSECQALYNNGTRVTHTMMCARRLNHCKDHCPDSCQGDSGGPLFVLQEGTNDHYLQVGIVSFGKGCGDRRYPGIYSRVSRFTKWIMRILGSDGDCAAARIHRRRGSG